MDLTDAEIISRIGGIFSGLSGEEVEKIKDAESFSKFDQQAKEVCWFMANQTRKLGHINNMEMVLRMLGYTWNENATAKNKAVWRSKFLKKMKAAGKNGTDFQKKYTERRDIKIPGQKAVIRYTRKNQEVYMLTEKFTKQLAMTADTLIGNKVRLYYVSLLGTVAAWRSRKHKTEFSPGRAIKRVKSYETQSFNNAVTRCSKTPMDIYGKINEETSKIITGKSKYELAKELDKPSHDVNLRDHMSKAQLAAVELAQILTAFEMKEKKYDCDPLEEHKRTLAKFKALESSLHNHKLCDTKRLNPRRARVEQDLLMCQEESF